VFDRARVQRLSEEEKNEKIITESIKEHEQIKGEQNFWEYFNP